MLTNYKVSLLFLVFFSSVLLVPAIAIAQGSVELVAPPTIHQSTTGAKGGNQFEPVGQVVNGNVQVESRSFISETNNLDSLSQQKPEVSQGGNWFTKKLSGAWNWVVSVGQTKIQSPTLLAVSTKIQSLDSRFGLTRLFGSNIAGIQKSFKQKSVGGFFKNVGGIVLKTTGIVAGAAAVGVMAGSAWLLATGQAAVLSASAVGAVKWVQTITAPAVKFISSGWKWLTVLVPKAWKAIDKFTLSVTRVTNRVANAISKYITIGGEISKTGDALAKTTRTWGKILNGLMAGLFAIGSTLSTGALVGTVAEKPTPPLETNTAAEKNPSTNKVSTKSTGSTTPSASKTSNTSTSTEQTKKSNPVTVTTKTEENAKPKSETIPKAVAIQEKTSAPVKAVSTPKAADSVKASTTDSKASVSSTPTPKATQSTVVAKASPVSLAGVTQAVKTLSSAVGKIGTNVSKVLSTEIPRYLSAGYYPQGQANANPSAYQKATIITWASFAGVLATSIGAWAFFRLRKNRQSESSVMITES